MCVSGARARGVTQPEHTCLLTRAQRDTQMNNALTGRFEIGIAVKASQNGPDVEMKQDGTEEKEATWC